MSGFCRWSRWSFRRYSDAGESDEEPTRRSPTREGRVGRRDSLVGGVVGAPRSDDRGDSTHVEEKEGEGRRGRSFEGKGEEELNQGRIIMSSGLERGIV